MNGILFIVPTPIGNLEDMTFRAIQTLKDSDVILAEDTRTSSVLLRHFNIDKPLRPYHQHNEHKIIEDVVSEIASGKVISLISDAGTPGISDPGFLIVRECVRKGLPVVTLPGATAFVPALVNSGLPCNFFSFYGFLPQKKGRQTMLKLLATEQKTFVVYESPFRLVKLLGELKEHLGEQRQASVSREISKKFEETKRGTLKDLFDYFNSRTIKGEIVVVIQGTDSPRNDSEDTDESDNTEEA